MSNDNLLLLLTCLAVMWAVKEIVRFIRTR